LEESDGINELTGATMRVALTVAGVIAEGRIRQREAMRLQEEAANEERGHESASRLASDPAAARAALAAPMDDGWWEQAQVYDIACAWETAKTWEDIDEDAERTARHVRAQLRRLGVDVDNLNADPHAVQRALRYDSRERCKRLAARLKALGVPAEAIAARVLADTNHAVPAREAVRWAPSAPRAKRSRANPSEDDDLERAREPGECPTTRRLDEVEYNARRTSRRNPISQRPDLGR
jgi:hypothetical protein